MQFQKFGTTGIALLILAIVWTCLAATFPAFPVDETRYLTVAWEMRHSGNWILPTLNGEPYSHKPPLLFWLINLVWTLTGPSVWSARIVSFAVAATVIVLTAKMARALFPDRPICERLAPLLVVASPPFLLYGNLIMFDFLIYASAMGSLLFLWKAAHENTRRSWLLFGLFMGTGVLAKGPVILVHILCPALLAPFLWLPANSGYTKTQWYLKVMGGIGIATLIGLTWAIPAAIMGGPEFTRMIFWGQSAGRMVNAFAHKHPPWFYLQFVPVFMLPWLLTSTFWQGMKTVKQWPYTSASRFLLSWIVPSFLVFCAISGKQLHYIIPLTSAFAILVTAGISHANTKRKVFPAYAVFYALLFCVLAAAPMLPHLERRPDNQVMVGITHFESWPFLVAAAVALSTIWIVRGQFMRQTIAVAFLAGLVLCIVSVQGARHFYRLFDLEPVGSVVHMFERQGHTFAFAPKYAGEIGFTARLEQSVTPLEIGNLQEWLDKDPKRIAIVRHENYQLLPEFETLYSTRYKGDQRISLIKKSE
jgi:4-amino-4-deoxy-L-arabinose transferase-like glycosyltransferase